MTYYRLLADLVFIVHLAYIAVVVFGLLAILIGFALRWNWVRNRWFRGIHLAMIGIVVTQSLLGITCPLTTLEFALREKIGQTVFEGTSLLDRAHWLIFYDGPPWAFTLSYCVFGSLVLATIFLVPPRWSGKPK
jgi:hypothetical protein